LIVTTSRAVERDDDIQVTLSGGETHQATLLGHDPSTDLALLQLDATLATPTWVGEEGLEVGQLALMAGRPDKGIQASLGIIGALGSAWRTAMGGRVSRRIQVDARAFPGFSGGPLLNTSGQILGVNTASLAREAPVTLPTETVRRVVEALQMHGRMRRGYVGVSGQPVKLPESLRETAGQVAGLLVTSVETNSPASRAGVLIGDILLTFGGERVRHPAQLLAQLDGETVGKEVSVTLARAGTLTELNVSVKERP
jgi:S1-C subfamily serine protease